MKTVNLEDDLLAVKRVFVGYQRRLEKLKDDLKRISEERQDLLHAFELGKLDAILMTKLSKELKKVQQRRREIKNEIEILSELSGISNARHIKESEIDRVLSRIKYLKEQQAARVYSMRVRKDLQELVD